MASRPISERTVQALLQDCEQFCVNMFGVNAYEFIADPTCCSRLGEGIHGICNKVQVSQSQWVIKLASDELQNINGLQREIEAMSSLHGVPGVQKVIGVCPWKLTMITEFAGDSLEKYLKTHTCTTEESLQIVQQVSRTLVEVNARGWLHNDLKIDNICIQKTDKGIQTTIIDFGLATKIGGTLPIVPGSVASFHTAPEVVKRLPLTPKADVYSVGRLLQHLVPQLNRLDPPVLSWLTRSVRINPNLRDSLDELLKVLG
ncbi:dual specificity testis-specific protein kinase 1-like [Homarus americanus]|uniref:dual specificity testis-specific protein kinase 1-like n=1 Tax=Homarus americanus TaxID=6706 RepID=UPI001C48661C|nr:dual specificity testis-specific protein kinase 1-like [Homarus americanus]